VEQIRSDLVGALAALLDREGAAPNDGDPLPPMWQIVFFLPRPAQREAIHPMPRAALPGCATGERPAFLCLHRADRQK